MRYKALNYLILLVTGIFALSAVAAAAPPEDRGPPTASKGLSFRVEIDGMTPAAFANVEGLDSDTEVIEFREGGDVEAIRKVPGVTRYANIVLSADPKSPALGEYWAWRQEVIDGTLVRKSGTVIVFDQAGTEVARWHFERAWPCKWNGPIARSDGTEVAVEQVVLAVERIERG